MGSLEDMTDVLAAAEVHIGFPQKRRELAGDLISRGVLVSEAEALIAHCVGTCSPPATTKVLVSILEDEAKCRSRLADLRAVEEARGRRRRAFGDKPSQIAPLPGEDQEVWDHDRQCRIAYCRVVADRRSVQEIATELAVSVTTCKVMVERGRTLQVGPGLPAPDAKVFDTDAEQEKRREKFLADMRAKKPLDSSAATK